MIMMKKVDIMMNGRSMGIKLTDTPVERNQRKSWVRRNWSDRWNLTKI